MIIDTIPKFRLMGYISGLQNEKTHLHIHQMAGVIAGLWIGTLLSKLLRIPLPQPVLPVATILAVAVLTRDIFRLVFCQGGCLISANEEDSLQIEFDTGLLIWTTKIGKEDRVIPLFDADYIVKRSQDGYTLSGTPSREMVQFAKESMARKSIKIYSIRDFQVILPTRSLEQCEMHTYLDSKIEREASS